MHICVITPKYPTETDPTALTFVQQLVWSLADQGEEISVICPIPISFKKKIGMPLVITEKTYAGKIVNVYFPRYIYFGQKWIGKHNTALLSTKFFGKAVDEVVSKMGKKPDVYYGHFVTPSGIVASQLGKKYGKPSFLAYGESSPWTIEQYGRDSTKKMLSNLNGVISVSSYNKKELSETGVVNEQIIGVFPNGYRTNRFTLQNQLVSRNYFNIHTKKFVVAFVGHFIERKGIGILKAAVDTLPDVCLICAGKGPLKPQGENVLFADIVNPNDLSFFYSAADVFVLPTLNEGCCNAIIEAMACGLPIISSNLPFNDDILDDTNSLRINPLSVNEIADAIEKMQKDDLLRKKLSQGSIRKAKSLTLEMRSSHIIEFIKQKNK